jgi:hypothetical protein
MADLPREIIGDAPQLFWDTDPSTIDPETHAPYVIARVLSYGTLRTARALEAYYGRGRIRSFFLEGGFWRVDPQTAALWCVLLGLSRDECTKRSSPFPRETLWDG